MHRARIRTFVGFTDEEQGDVGSSFYVRQMTNQQAGAIDAMVNIDTLGLGPTKVWASHSDQRLIAALAYIANRLNASLERVDVDGLGWTDADTFAARDIPRITIHSLTQKTWDAHILHSSKDNISAMRLDDYYQTYRLLAAYVAYLDEIATAPEKQPAH